MSNANTAAEPTDRNGAGHLSIDKKKAFLMALCTLFSFHAGFRGPDADYDSFAYVDFYERLSASSFREFASNLEGDSLYYAGEGASRFEVGFALLSFLISRSSSKPAFYFFVLCFISLYLKMKAIERLSVAPALSALWYFTWYYMLLEMNAMRAGIAAGILILATKPLMDRRYILFYGCVLIATLFHVSALIAVVLPGVAIIRLGRVGLLLVLALAMAGGSLDVGPFLVALGGKLGVYYEFLTMIGLYSELNRFNVVMLLRLSVLIAMIWNYDKLIAESKANKVFVNLFLLSIVVYFLLSSFPVVAARLYELLGVYQIFAVGALAVAFRRKFVAYGLVVAVSLAQFYALAYHSHVVDFFYFIGRRQPVELKE